MDGDGVRRHVCVAAILRSAGRILLCHRRADRQWYPDVWDLPGGHLELGETPAEALARELHEELGVLVRPPIEPPFVALHDDGTGIDLSVWLIDEWDGTPANHAMEEHDQVEWYAAETVAHLRLAHPSYVGLLQRAVLSL